MAGDIWHYLTNIISLVRFAIGTADSLEPFPDTVEQRFRRWLREQEGLGREFTPEQIQWLEMIKDHIATSVVVQKEDFENTPFHERGGLVRAHRLFGEQLETILDEINETLAA